MSVMLAASTAAGLGPVAELHTLRRGQRLADTWRSLEEHRTGSLRLHEGPAANRTLKLGRVHARHMLVSLPWAGQVR